MTIDNKYRKIIKEKIRDLFLINEFNNILTKHMLKLDNTNSIRTSKQYLKLNITSISLEFKINNTIKPIT